jgi:hypothetical protein
MTLFREVGTMLKEDKGARVCETALSVFAEGLLFAYLLRFMI